MLGKSRIWIFNNFHLILALLLSTLFFYLSLSKDWSLVFFFILLLFMNFYFLRGMKVFTATFLAPLPFLSLQSFFVLNNVAASALWLIALFFLWKMEKVFWLGCLFLILLLGQLLLGTVNLSPFVATTATLLFLLAIFIFIFGQRPSVALVKSIITVEFLWLFFFLPLSFIWRSILSFAAFYFVIFKNRL